MQKIGNKAIEYTGSDFNTVKVSSAPVLFYLNEWSKQASILWHQLVITSFQNSGIQLTGTDTMPESMLVKISDNDNLIVVKIKLRIQYAIVSQSYLWELHRAFQISMLMTN